MRAPRRGLRIPKGAPRQRRRPVNVRSYCRRPTALGAAWQRVDAKVKEWGF